MSEPPRKRFSKKGIKADASKLSEAALALEQGLLARVVGQDRAVRQFVQAFEMFSAGLNELGRPLANLLFLGPSGVGKTRIVEAACEILFGTARAMIKVDCAEFQRSHEIAKLIGSPPGYVGHRETHPIITQEALAAYHTDKLKISFLLFDEIEKANEALLQLLLGMLDKATLTLGDNRKVDLSRTVIILTSNLGSKQISRLMAGNSYGFHPDGESHEELDKQVYEVSMEEVKRFFAPELLGRLDRTVVFRPLSRESLRAILNIELTNLQNRLTNSGKPVFLDISERAKDFLLEESDDAREGARHIKKSIRRFITAKLSSVIATRQAESGDRVLVDREDSANELTFFVQKSLPPIPVSATLAMDLLALIERDKILPPGNDV
jgi:ATP-dependent Clp protease ATP-binding subunit ClpB